MRFEDDVLYRLAADVARHDGGRRRSFRLSPEEVMVLVADLLDGLKEAPDDAEYRCQTAWDALLYDVRLLDADAPEDDVRDATAMVLELAALLLSLTDEAWHRTCTLELMCALQEHAAAGGAERTDQLAWRIGESRLKMRMEAYWQTEGFLSDDIYEALHDGAGEEPAEAKPKGVFRIARGAEDELCEDCQRHVRPAHVRGRQGADSFQQTAADGRAGHGLRHGVQGPATAAQRQQAGGQLHGRVRPPEGKSRKI